MSDCKVHPITVTLGQIDDVSRLIKEDLQVTYSEIHVIAIWIILHKQLSVKKVRCRWITNPLKCEDRMVRRKFWRPWIYSYYWLSKQQCTIWMFQNDMRPTEVKQSQNIVCCRKTMLQHFANLTTKVFIFAGIQWISSTI